MFSMFLWRLKFAPKAIIMLIDKIIRRLNKFMTVKNSSKKTPRPYIGQKYGIKRKVFYSYILVIITLICCIMGATGGVDILVGMIMLCLYAIIVYESKPSDFSGESSSSSSLANSRNYNVTTNPAYSMLRGNISHRR